MSAAPDTLAGDPGADARPRSGALELLSFVLVGGAAAAGYAAFSVLMIGLRTGIPDWVMSAGCYALFIGPVYLAHRRFSFKSDAPHAIALPRYVAVQMSALVLAALFSYVCYSIFDLATPLAAMLVVGLTAGVNFFVLKLWAFANRS